MAHTIGYVGTIEAETRDTRLWFSLTAQAKDAGWVKIGAPRAWFTMNMKSADRPSHMAQLTLRLHVRLSEVRITL